MTVSWLAAALILMAVFVAFSKYKIIARLCLNCVIGISSLFAGNYILSSFGISVGINLFTCLFTGILGVPGAAGLFIIRFMM